MFRRRKQRDQTTKLNTYSYYKTNGSGGSKKDSTKRGLSRFARAVKPHFSVFRMVVVLSGLISVGFLLSVETTPIIRFTSPGVNARDTDIYRSGAQGIIKSSVFNRSKLTFDYRGVEESLKTKFPEIETISISFDVIGRKPVIQMFMHKPTYLFSTNGTSWAIDDRGVAIGRQNDLKESFTGSLDTITDEIGVQASIGDTLISPLQVTFLTAMIDLLSKQQAVVEAIYIPLNPKQIDIVVRGEGWRYKLNSESTVTSQANQLSGYTSANGNTPSEYVDVRVPEKVYWR